MKELKNIIKWVDALESGKYKQGKNKLGDHKSGFCCLGVGCKVLKIDYDPRGSLSESFAYSVGLLKHDGYFSQNSLPYYRNTFFGKTALTTINDDTKAGFKRIAKLIKNHPDWLFEEEVAKAVKEYYKINKK